MTGSTPDIFWDHSQVSPEDREKLLNQRGCVMWFTGLSGSGKSTIARALEYYLVHRGRLAYVLDGDNIRHGLNAGLGFSDEDRVENLRRISEVSKLFAECGVLCLTAFISPLRSSRELAREIIGAERFVEIYVSTPLEVCEQRDVKGLYRRARTGEVKDFTGISSPFEPPEDPDVLLDTATLSVDDSVAAITDRLQARGFLPPPG